MNGSGFWLETGEAISYRGAGHKSSFLVSNGSYTKHFNLTRLEEFALNFTFPYPFYL